jgi:hypothetical protein
VNAWLGFVEERIADTENRLAMKRRQRTDVEDLIRSNILSTIPEGGKVPTLKVQGTIIQSSPTHRELETEIHILKHKLRRYQAKFNSYDRDRQFLSRNVENRRMSWEGGRSQAGGRPSGASYEPVPSRMR